MGIKGLTTFINKNFRGWKQANFKEWDHIVIDGHNVCCMLYRKSLPWALGGEYNKFSALIEEFFREYSFNDPVVIFDGASSDQSKVTTVRRRREECMSDMKAIQDEEAWDTSDTSSGRILPPLIIATFISTLEKLGIKYYIADGEADKEMAALANHYKCPVLASDSDFFIFNLKYGFVHFNRLHCDRNDYSLYYIKDFQKQFKLREYELCLIIPAFLGNDFINGRFYYYSTFLEKLSKHATCEEYFRNCRKDMRILPQDYDNVKKFYCDLQLPDFYTRGAKNPTSMYGLPEWFYSSYKEGKFPVELLDAFLNQSCILPRVVEAIEYESAWKISRAIRQCLYHVMGLRQVTETIRVRSEAAVIDELVPAVPLKPPVSIHDDFFCTRNVDMLRSLLLQILKCNELVQEDLELLRDDFKLPIAAAIYWYQNLDNPPSQRKLVMCLLLSFLKCSEVLPREDFPFSRVKPSTKSDHLKALHVFAQWQCVYFDAMSLNYLAREPFPTTSPARLYSGNVAMHYAFTSTQNEKWLDTTFVCKDSEWRLFNQLLYLVTGRDEEGRVGKHCL